jgi:DNA-directed DNA polymerase III PolC
MFTPLHVKSDYSLGYGTAAVDELVAAAAALGYRTLALTDLENLYGQVHFHHQCRRHGIRPLTGIELRPGFDGRRQAGQRTGRLLLLAADAAGYRSLCRIVSCRRGAAGMRGEGALGGDPLPLVASQPEGLFALSDNPDVVARLLAAGTFLRQRLGLLLVRPEAPAADRARQEAARRLGVQLVADLDAVFPQPADHRLHLLQRAIRQGRGLGEVTAGDDIWSRERWLRPPAAAAALFADLPQTVAATVAIAEACRLDLAAPLRRPGDPPGAAERLRRLCDEAHAGMSPVRTWHQAHAHRLAEELALFARLGFSGWLLIIAEILSHCRREGIPVAVRGSAVSSLTLHLLGGSPVDPLAHGLLFERFLHPGKSAWPDVDIDLPWQRRDGVIDWVYGHFGRERVAMVAAHHTFQQRAALREGLKAWGVDPALIDRLSRALPPEDLPVEEVDFLGLAATAASAPLAELAATTADLGKILPLCQRLIGRPRHIAAHPGGIVVGDPPLHDLLPLERAPKGVVITQYDGAALERLGVAKIDLLGNRCLSELEETFALTGQPPLRLEAIPGEDAPTLALIDRAETLGCFQLESPAMRSLLARLPIHRQSDLVAALALIRPGAAAGSAKAAFVRRARGEEPSAIPFPLLADRLAETHGLLLFEEDIMLLLSRTGGLNLGEADELRAAIINSGGDAAALADLEASLLQRAAGQGTAETSARQAWAAAACFAAYSFNKAHAASYGRLAYLSAYSKAHHPVEFACALLNHHQGLYPLRTLAAEFARMGVELRGPHVNFSTYPSGLETGLGEGPAAVRVGLDKVRGLSRRGSEALLQERAGGGPFGSLRELLERVRLNRREVAALILAGVCDGLPPLTTADYPFAHEAALDWLKRGGALTGLDRLPIPRPVAVSERGRLFQRLVRVRNELRILQMHLLAHPMALLRPEAQRYACRPIFEAVAAPAGAKLRLAVIVAAMRRVPTRQGPMQFLTVEDETGLLEAAVLPPAYRRLGERIATPGPFLIEGRLRRQQGAIHLDVGDITPFHERERPYGLNV